MATNHQGQPVRLSGGPAVEAIPASSVIPGVFPPVQIDDDILMDGAIAANTPLAPRVASSCLPYRHPGDRHGPKPGRRKKRGWSGIVVRPNAVALWLD
jgi:hypothetical protein